ncbi:ABC transporter permease subunit [Pseudonocardia ailaonensis]|uniref:ABC transporter permease subunit n=1 Tax=Pseudonocardia ailaonensis TaxID=367279 RepID=A0ABN2N3H6_9PSEU
MTQPKGALADVPDTDEVAAKSSETSFDDYDRYETATFTQRVRAAIPSSLARTLVSVLVLLILWEIVARFIIDNQLVLVGPIEVWESLSKKWEAGTLQVDMGVSAREFLQGFVVGVGVGIPLGLLLGSSRRLREYIDPVINAAYATPIIALAPLFILWFGIGERKTVVLVFLLVVLPVIVATDLGIRSTEPVLIEAGKAFGTSKWQRFTMVQLPWSLSFIVSGLRLAIGRGLIGVVAGELFGSSKGLGYMIYNASQVFDTGAVLGGVAIFAFVGVVLVMVMEWVERRIAPWREDR